MFVLDREQTVKLEKLAVDEGESLLRLMYNAGTAVYNFIIKNLKNYSKNILILCGKGNNGGDGFVVAEKLLDANYDVSVVLLDGEPKTDIAKFFYNNIICKNINLYKYSSNNKENDIIFDLIRNSTLIVDAVYGIGFRGDVKSDYAPIFNLINNSKGKILSVDVPSGLDCDGKEISPHSINADYTVTFSALKPVNVLYPGNAYCGEIHVANVGINFKIFDKVDYFMKVIGDKEIYSCIKKRNKNAHKGSFGKAICICGSVGMAGAAILSGNAATKSGAGLVELLVARDIYNIVASNLIEPIFTVLEQNSNGQISACNLPLILERLKTAKSCLIGCGLGQSLDLTTLLSTILKEIKIPTVLDADALNIISDNMIFLKDSKNENIIVTPHPGEMAKLMGTTVEQIQKNRKEYAVELARKYNITVVLKGSNTIVAGKNGEIFVNITGNPGMAKGGSGDVLSGVIVSLLAQGIKPIKAAVCGVYIHGLAGDICAKKYSQTSMTASDLVNELKNIFLKIESKSLL